MPFHLRNHETALPRWRQALADFGPTYAASGFIGCLFAATGPVAIILSVATRAGLSEAEIASWLFGVFFINGLITIFFCLRDRQPLAFFWTSPGTVLVGTALSHLRFAEVIGAYYVTGVLMLLLGATGWVTRVMKSLPMPIVMGMVAGVFLRFGLDLVRSLHADFAIAGPMVVAWLVLSAVPIAGRRLPPLIGALLVGVATIVVLGRMDPSVLGALELVRPVMTTPEWSWPAMVELVVPLAITVLVVQNGQGFAVVKAAGHEPPVDAITIACGIGAIASATVGSISTCLTGPTNAGYLSVFPTGVAQPLASNLNFAPGQTVPNLVIVALGTGGTVQIYNSAGNVDVIADVVGWFTDGSDPAATGSIFRGLTPARITDTRPGSGQANAGLTLGASGILSVAVAGQGGVPVVGGPAAPTAAVLNVTVTGASAASFLTVYPSGAVRPLASNLNWVPGLTVPNLVVVKLGPDGKVNVFNSAGSVDVIVDVVGWYW